MTRPDVIPIPLRADVTAHVHIPLDMSEAEARKICAVIMAYAQGIEAASAAETPKSGSVHESPVANGMMRPMTVEELTTAGREAA